MIPVPSGVQVCLASGHTDMRKGFDGLALLVQETLKRNPHNAICSSFAAGAAGSSRCSGMMLQTLAPGATQENQGEGQAAGEI
jgi:transposase